jgi:hypothetical protein
MRRSLHEINYRQFEEATGIDLTAEEGKKDFPSIAKFCAALEMFISKEEDYYEKNMRGQKRTPEMIKIYEEFKITERAKLVDGISIGYSEMIKLANLLREQSLTKAYNSESRHERNAALKAQKTQQNTKAQQDFEDLFYTKSNEVEK